MNNSDSLRQIQPWLVRSLLAVGALFSILFVIYASLVPLNYTPKSFAETLAIFQTTPWFRLGIERRADWVANGLIMLPPGFLAAGAIDWRRTQRWLLLITSPIIVALLIATVVGIEFVQIWFPPRVVSQNDIFAGVLGSVGGVLLWWFAGRNLLGQLEQFFLSPPGLLKWKLLMNLGVIALLIYNLMPLDILLSLSELREKWGSGGIRIIPFQDFQLSKKSLLFLGFAFARVAPFAFVTQLESGTKRALAQGILLAILMEIVKIPIHSRQASATGMVAGAFGVAAAVFCAPTLICWLKVLDRASAWFAAAFLWTGVMLVGFLGHFDSIERDPVVLQQRFQGIWVVPFARAHSSSEFEAGENILTKLVVFAVLTFLLSGWQSRRRPSANLAAIISMLWCCAMCFGVETAQVLLPPLVPDGTDFILYFCGAILGVLSFRMLIAHF